MGLTAGKFVIIDGNALLHRAWHALPATMKNKAGQITNAVYGFTLTLFKAIKELHPTYVAVCFDTKGETFRDKIYKEYKAGREKKPQELYNQIPMIQEILDSLRIKYYQEQGVEADDLIGTLCRSSKFKVQSSKSIIVTGDLDTLQLVNENTEVYTLKKGITETVIYDVEEVKRHYDGLVPEQMIDFKALRGDPSDNIPGAKGIGEKTAILLLQKFSSVENLYKAMGQKKVEELVKTTGIKEGVWQKLKESEEDVKLSKTLATIKTDFKVAVDLEQLKFGGFNLDEVMQVFKKYDFHSLVDRIRGVAEEYGVSKLEESEKDERSQTGQKYILVETEEQMRNFLKELSEQKEVVIDIESDGLDVISSKLIGMSFCWESGRAYYINNFQFPISSPNANISNFQFVLEDEHVKKIGHNLKFDWHILKNSGIELKGIYFDTMIAAYLLNPGSRRYGLDSLVFQYFGIQMQKIEELIGVKGQSQLNLGEVDISKKANYSAADADWTFRLYKKLSKEVNSKNLDEVFFKIEMPLVEVLGEMEKKGVKLNQLVLKELGKKVSRELKREELEIYKLAGRQFNVSSPKQLKEVLFEHLSFETKGIRKTKTGISTAASELEKMRGKHPIINHIFSYRELAKLKSTYIDALPSLINRADGRIHTSFNQTITTTGRLSSSDPNMQNIPVRTDLGREIRRAFIAEKGYLLLSLDYSQIDLRAAAHLSGDKSIIQIFKEDKDIHTMTAARLFNKKSSEVSPEERSRAKEANFGVLYGLGPRGLAERLGLSQLEAEDFIDRYKNVYPQVFKYLEGVIESTRRLGYVETLFGRRRYLPEINSGSSVLAAQAERAALNMPVQGTSSDIIKKAMIEIRSKLKGQSSKLEIRMLLQVHDELVFEVREDRVKKWAKVIKEEMENAVRLKVPLKVEAKVGRSWGEMAVI